MHFVLAHGTPGEYFPGSGVVDESSSAKGKQRLGAWRDIWLGSGLFEGLSGFVLGWAGVGGVVR